MSRRTPNELAGLLVRLYDERFGGSSSGKFRISRKFLRKLAGRRKLPDAYLAAIAEELFEIGFVFIDCESYSVVLSQKQFASYRRVTSLAVDGVSVYEQGQKETSNVEKNELGEGFEIEESSGRIGSEIH
ncbi:MAG: hypothetical protein R3245_08835 [Kiloniellales bacterium]|nr:hypothetical protein [Kiloniellales bacterium]